MSNPIEEALGESREHLCYSDGCSSRTFPCSVVDDIDFLITALRSGEWVVVKAQPTIVDTDEIAEQVNYQLQKVWKENGYKKPVPEISPAIARYCIENYLCREKEREAGK